MSKPAILGGTPIRTTPFPMEEPQITETDIEAVLEAIREKRLSIFSSSKIVEFEEQFSKYIGTQYAVAVTSGTAALQAALAGAEIGAGADVIVPVYTYASTINAILLQGANPVFVDINPDTYGIDGTNLDQLEKALRSSTKAIMVVDLFGLPVPRTKLVEFAAQNNLALIEDCAQSTGSMAHGRKVGSFGIGCHSFGEIKNMTSAEGGMITTNDAQVARRARMMRHSGECWRSTRITTIGSSPSKLYEMIDGIDYEFVGTNFRMNALQAALGKSQLSRLDLFNASRIQIAGEYQRGLVNRQNISCPSVSHEVHPVYNRFPIAIKPNAGLSRNAFLAAIISEGVPAGVYYPLPFNETEVMKRRAQAGGKAMQEGLSEKGYPGAIQACREHILLPCYPGLSNEDAAAAIEAVLKVVAAAKDGRTAAAMEEAGGDLAATYFGQFFTRAN